MRFKRRPLAYLYLVLLIGLVGMSSCVQAYQSRQSNFSGGYTLNRDLSNNLYQVAVRQVGRTQASLKYTEAWCADFVMDCAQRAQVPSSVIPHKTTATAGNLYSVMVKNCGAKTISAAQAKPGDIVFYYCNAEKQYVHVGIVGEKGYFIEGNVGGKVLRYQTPYIDAHGHSGNTIRRVYVRPDYGNLSKYTVSLSTYAYTYSGLACKPAVKVSTGTVVLRSGTDYTVSYAKNTNAGTASVTVKAKGAFQGSKTVSFKIAPMSVGRFTMGLSASRMTYTGKARTPLVLVRKAPSVLLFANFKKGKGYTVSYSNHVNLGTGVVTVNGIGNFTGKQTLSFRIFLDSPNKITFKKTATSVTASWTGVTGAASYRLQYRKKGTSSWTTVFPGKKTSYQVKGLKRNTQYEFRVCAISGNNVSSDTSGSVKTNLL